MRELDTWAGSAAARVGQYKVSKKQLMLHTPLMRPIDVSEET